MKFSTRTKFLAVLFATVTAAAPAIAGAAPLSNLFHLHPHTRDSRVRVELYNQTFLHDQVRIAGKIYDVEPYCMLVITAPAGTQIYAASKLRTAAKGSLLYEIAPQDETHRLTLN